MATSFARSEREGLVASARLAGPDAPTKCGDWSVRELLVHLCIREGDPIGAPGILVPALSGLTERAERRLVDWSFERLCDRVARPPLWSPARIQPLDALINAMEFFVHHEDIRRGQPDWRPRGLARPQQDLIWRFLGPLGKPLARPAKVPVRMLRTDTGAESTLVGGADPAVIRGLPEEVALFLYGRAEVAEIELSGPPSAVAAVRGADFGI